MRQLVYKGNLELYEDNGALFSNDKAFNAEHIVFCSKYKEIAYLMGMGIENVVCIKNNTERLKNFIRFREGRMGQVIIYVKSDSAHDVLKDICKKPYYTVNYVGRADDLENQTSVKDAIESRIENIQKDIELKELRDKLLAEEEDDDDLDAFTDSS